MAEDRDTRLKRLRLRSWRRGIREMDLILGPFADTALAGLADPALDAYEELLEADDHDLYLWVSGRLPAPEAHLVALTHIRRYHNLGDIGPAR